MFIKTRLWLHKNLGNCKFSKTTYRKYPHLDKSVAAYSVCEYSGCRNKKVLYDYSTELSRNEELF